MIKIIELDFYMKGNGKIPVQDFLYSLNPIFYFTYYNNKFVLLHGFIKKTMKTPENEIKRARKYMEDYKRRSES